MKCVLLFTALLAAWMSMSEATTCENISSCIQGMSKFAGADQSKIKEACDAMQNVLTCFRSALDDCRKKNPNSESELAPVASQMEGVQKMVDDNCGSGASAVQISMALVFFAILSSFFKF
ncbi:uncharacterized protein LOC143286549 [Babylonia areolata]|uniref:uncharacterized protein LOC143286549 n=1 Tax=Babylonia areolata TaxID=304850 RepID=UPI003FD56B29